MTYKTPMKATDPCELERRIMDGSIAKNEAEWWAQHEIEQLRQRVQELEERRCEICGYAEHHREHTGCLRTQLAAAQEECEFQRNAHKQAEELMLEQGNQLAAVQEEMNDWRNQAHQSQSAFDRLQDQLAKAEQLWQIAQGRCDGLEEKLAKAEQRAEWQPIETNEAKK